MSRTGPRNTPMVGAELEAKLQSLRALIESEQTAQQLIEYPKLQPPICRLTIKEKYALLDVGAGDAYLSGKYMVDLATGDIFGIKAYGRVHRGHRYGTLDTIYEWDWSGYTARPRSKFERADLGPGDNEREELAADLDAEVKAREGWTSGGPVDRPSMY